LPQRTRAPQQTIQPGTEAAAGKEASN